MSLSRQAKVLTAKQISALLDLVAKTRWAERNTVVVVLSCFTGLRAKEIAGLTWGSVMDGEGNIIETVEVTDVVAKGKTGGRVVPLKKNVVAALEALRGTQDEVLHHHPIIQSERGQKAPVTARTVVNAFCGWFDELGMEGCSSHSGRRSFITSAAKKITAAGGSLRDVQQMAGHSSLSMTQRYIEGDSEAKKRVVEML